MYQTMYNVILNTHTHTCIQSKALHISPALSYIISFSISEMHSSSNFQKNKVYEKKTTLVLQWTISAKDRGATKNPAVDLEMILVHQSYT